MKLSEQWLREWVNPTITIEALCNKLTMAGLEVDALTPVAEKFSDVVVGEVLQVEKHPEADRLKVCQVNIGHEEPLSIVCGAPNVKIGMKTAVALVGAKLPNDFHISRSKIRNIVSYGMLCSGRELGMFDDKDGILDLAKDAPIGQDIWEYFCLSDHIIDIAITPNRGDCLSTLGIAREVSALTEANLILSDMPPQDPIISDTLPIEISVPAECPRYVGRIIRHVKADAVTPLWMQERLRRGGIRSINAVVDVMNYVMLEYGQPMHAFDLAKLKGKIEVRKANKNEALALLNGETVELTQDTMVIADEHKPLAIAGLMGGLESGVSLLTTDIFLESAFFHPESIARSGRNYHLNSDSSYRFERGIDPDISKKAIERATELLLSIVGGKPGPIVDVTQDAFLPKITEISLRAARIDHILGITIDANFIENSLQRLGFTIKAIPEGWLVSVPPRRSDIKLEIDLIEEVIRLYGYEALPTHRANLGSDIQLTASHHLTLTSLRSMLVSMGYHEVITYSFIDKTMQNLLDPDHVPQELVNPITTDMSVMRTNLWPGLIKTYLYNQNRQQSRVRIFETGLRFITQDDIVLQQNVLSGLISGTLYKESWGSKPRIVDFFDLKGDLESIFGLTLDADAFKFVPSSHPALHPGQTADIYRKDLKIGTVGLLHPSTMQVLGLTEKVFIFEMALDALQMTSLPYYTPISKFPEIRRDIAIFVDQTVPAQVIQDTIREVGGSLLKEVTVFDVYQGKGVAPHQKSIALALTLQHESRTLVDEEVADIMEDIIAALKQRFAAELRG